MAMSVTYATVHGRLVEENRGGVVTEYVPDTLGNVIMTTDESGTVTSTTTYWPFGEVRSQTGTNPSPWGFCGVWGYLTDAVSRMYVRARHYRADASRWFTVDPLWPEELAYDYVSSLPSTIVDPSGLSYGPPLLITPDVYNALEKMFDDSSIGRACNCFACSLAMLVDWYRSRTHNCHHKYTHCMACCILSRKFGFQCAIDQQMNQNKQPGVPDRFKTARLSACKNGAAAIINPGVSCDSWCKRIEDYGKPNNGPHCRDQKYPGYLPVPKRCL